MSENLNEMEHVVKTPDRTAVVWKAINGGELNNNERSLIAGTGPEILAAWEKFRTPKRTEKDITKRLVLSYN